MKKQLYFLILLCIIFDVFCDNSLFKIENSVAKKCKLMKKLSSQSHRKSEKLEQLIKLSKSQKDLKYEEKGEKKEKLSELINQENQKDHSLGFFEWKIESKEPKIEQIIEEPKKKFSGVHFVKFSNNENYSKNCYRVLFDEDDASSHSDEECMNPQIVTEDNQNERENNINLLNIPIQKFKYDKESEKIENSQEKHSEMEKKFLKSFNYCPELTDSLNFEDQDITLEEMNEFEKRFLESFYYDFTICSDPFVELCLKNQTDENNDSSVALYQFKKDNKK